MTKTVAEYLPKRMRNAMAPGLRAAAPAAAQAMRTDSPTSLYAWYVLAVLFVIYVLNFIDRNILSILAQDIKG